MTPHYDLKQQEKEQWCFEGWAGGGGGSQTFLSYICGGRVCFSNGIVGGGIVNIFAYHTKM